MMVDNDRENKQMMVDNGRENRQMMVDNLRERDKKGYDTHLGGTWVT